MSICAERPWNCSRPSTGRLLYTAGVFCVFFFNHTYLAVMGHFQCKDRLYIYNGRHHEVNKVCRGCIFIMGILRLVRWHFSIEMALWYFHLWLKVTKYISVMLCRAWTVLYRRSTAGISSRIYFVMMTSSNGNIFRIAGSLCGEWTGNRWILLKKASDTKLWCFLWSAPEQTVPWTIVRLVIWDAIALIMMSL